MMLNTNMFKPSSYQLQNILLPMKSGQKLDCNEGVNYKCWLVVELCGKKIRKYVRKNSVESLCRNKVIIFDFLGNFLINPYIHWKS